MDHKFLTFNICYSYIKYFTVPCLRPFTFAMKFSVCRFTNGLNLKTLNTDFSWFLSPFFFDWLSSTNRHEKEKWEGYLEKIKDMRIFWFERKLKCCYFYMQLFLAAVPGTCFQLLLWRQTDIMVKRVWTNTGVHGALGGFSYPCLTDREGEACIPGWPVHSFFVDFTGGLAFAYANL